MEQERGESKGNRDVIQRDHDDCSSRISEQVRVISIAVLALIWLFIAGGDDKPTLPSAPDIRLLLASAGLSILAMVFDYFQYLMGYLSSESLLRYMEKHNQETGEYDSESSTYRLRGIFFTAKQVLCGLSVFLLFFAISASLLCKS